MVIALHTTPLLREPLKVDLIRSSDGLISKALLWRLRIGVSDDFDFEDYDLEATIRRLRFGRSGSE